MITQSCQSTGKETIYNFVKRILQMTGNIRGKPNLEKMVFCNANGECLNVGRPVGLLSTEETYKCYFKSKCRAFDPSDLCRQYAVEDYSSDWNLSYFQVFCSEGTIAPGVSDLTKTIITKMMVDFFNDETIFEALVRDNRFKEEKLRSCGATFNQTQIPLSVNAIHIQYKDIKIVSLNEKDSQLPEAVSPRTRPKSSVTATSSKPKQRKQENTSATCSALPGDSSTPVSARPSRKRRDKSSPWVDITFDIKFKTLTVGKDSREIMKRRISENFALKQGHTGYVSEHEDLIQIAQSVGAIFKLDPDNHPCLVGTCFRIGEEYIITNKHVQEEITTMAKDLVYVNFNFKKRCQANSKRSFIDYVVMSSTELDYAIFRMKKSHEQLPPSIFAHGVSIMNPEYPERNWKLLRDKPLRLIGHPQGEPKLMDLMCTVNARRQSGLACWCYTLRRGEVSKGEAVSDYHQGKDRRRITYHTSNFFHGSSGSPGIVLLNDKKWVVVLHARGFRDDAANFFIEQGVLLTEIFRDVQKQINEAQQGPLKDISVEDLFPSVDHTTPPCWSEPMEH